MNDNHKDFTIQITIPEGSDFDKDGVYFLTDKIQDKLKYISEYLELPPFEVALIGRNLRNGQCHGCTCEITSL